MSLLNAIQNSKKLFSERQTKLRKIDHNSNNRNAAAASTIETEGAPTTSTAAADVQPPTTNNNSTAPPSNNNTHPQPTAKSNKPKLPNPTAPASFYTSNRLQYVEDRILRFLSNVKSRFDSHNNNNTKQQQAIITRPTHWQTFPTQQAAFDYADNHDPEGHWLKVFAVEYNDAGKRRFLVTSQETLWSKYRDMLPQHRHYYEIIRQGRPCHLYLDLEYNIKDNVEKDGEAAVNATLSLFKDIIKAKFKLEVQDDWIVELDSCTETKFSRHIILRIPNKAFAHNAHVGVVVHELCRHAQQNADTDDRCKHLFVRKGEKEGDLFVDTGVYSRNRAFRLYLSSKAGKGVALTATNRFKSVGKTQYEIFMDSLVCNVPTTTNTTTNSTTIQEETSGITSLESTQVEVEVLRCFDESDVEAAALAGGGGGFHRNGRGGGSGAGNGRVGSMYCQYGPSPNPDVDAFITSVCAEGGVQGRIRSWAWLDDTHTLMLFNIADNRWCGNITRAHKSNGIFIVVDVVDGAWWQKCYDPECRNYRSPAMPLPTHLIQQQQPPEQQQLQQHDDHTININGGGSDMVNVNNDDREEEEEVGVDELAVIQKIEEEYIASTKSKSSLEISIPASTLQ